MILTHSFPLPELIRQTGLGGVFLKHSRLLVNASPNAYDDPSARCLAKVDHDLTFWQQQLQQSQQGIENEPEYSVERPQMSAMHTSNPSSVTVNPFDPMNPLKYWKALVERSEEELKSLERVYSTTLADSYEYWRDRYYLSENTLSLFYDYIQGQATQELGPDPYSIPMPTYRVTIRRIVATEDVP